MRDVMGIINVNVKDDILDELTYSRCIASVPFGGNYRLIDFMLSSMVNSGIQNVVVLTLHKYRSLMDYLGNGKAWDLNLNRKDEGLSILSPNVFYSLKYFQGDIQNFYSNIDFFQRSRQKDVLITRSNMICNLDITEVVNFHRRTQADITFLYRENDDLVEESPWRRKLEIGADGRVLNLEQGTEKVKGKKVLLEIFVMSKALLIDLIESCMINRTGDLLHDGIIKNQENLKIFAFPAKGYLGVINSIALYYKHSLNLLKPANWQELFFRPGFIYTKAEDEPPTKYMRGARVTGSLLAGSCVIEGKVENSVLFRGVQVKRDAYIKDSIILPESEIEEKAQIEYAILDKEVRVSRGKVVKGRKDNPSVIPERTII